MAVLPTPGSPDEHGVVLGPPRQDLDGAADLLVAADNRVELLVARGLRQVARIAFQGVVTFLGRGGVGRAALTQRLGGLFQSGGGHAGRLQRLGRVAAFLGQGDQQALGGDEGVAGGRGLGLGGGEHAGGLGPHIELARAALDLGHLGEQGFNGRIGLVRPAAGALDQGAGEAVGFLEQHLEQMLGRKLLRWRRAKARDWADWIACLARSE